MHTVNTDDTGGRLARPVGVVASIDEVTAWVREHPGLEKVLFVILLDWSAECQAEREKLRASAWPLVSLALEGMSGSIPPTAEQFEPWSDLAARTCAGKACFILAHTVMTYAERLSPAKRYGSTTHTAELVTGTIGEAPPATGRSRRRRASSTFSPTRAVTSTARRTSTSSRT